MLTLIDASKLPTHLRFCYNPTVIPTCRPKTGFPAPPPPPPGASIRAGDCLAYSHKTNASGAAVGARLEPEGANSNTARDTVTSSSKQTVRTFYVDTRSRDPIPGAQARLNNNKRDNLHQRRRLNNQQPNSNGSTSTGGANANPFRNQEGGASSSWGDAYVLARRLGRETLGILANHREGTLVIARRLKPDRDGLSGNQ